MIARRAAADCEPLQRACPDIAEFHSWYFRCRPGGLDQDGLAACILLGVPGPSTLDRAVFCSSCRNPCLDGYAAPTDLAGQ
jgi:hypothetical protein